MPPQATFFFFVRLLRRGGRDLSRKTGVSVSSEVTGKAGSAAAGSIAARYSRNWAS